MPRNITEVSTHAERVEWGRRSAAKAAQRRILADIDQVTFGVEIETMVPRGRIHVGSYHSPAACPSPFPSGWKVGSDGSIAAEYGYVGAEFVSPVLHGPTGLAEVVQALSAMSRLRAKVNASTGVHVHVGMPSILGNRANDFELVASWIARLVALTSRHEAVLLALGGTRTRFLNRYCRTIKEDWKHFRLRAKTLPRLPDYNQHAGRYHTLNLINLFDSKRTVEFRAFAGTLRPAKVVGYIVACLGLCLRAAAQPRAVKFDDTPAHLQLSGHGRALLTALWRDIDGYAWPSGAKAEWETRVINNQRWNVAKADQELTAYLAPLTGGGVA